MCCAVKLGVFNVKLQHGGQNILMLGLMAVGDEPLELVTYKLVQSIIHISCDMLFLC